MAMKPYGIGWEGNLAWQKVMVRQPIAGFVINITCGLTAKYWD